MSKFALAVDIGGTFTDAVLLGSDGRVWTDKTLTTHKDLLEGFFRVTQLVLSKAKIELKQINDVVTPSLARARRGRGPGADRLAQAGPV